MRFPGWRGAVAGAVTGGLVVLSASPAHAYATVNQPNIAITSAGPGGISGNANFTPDFGWSGGIVDIAVAVSFNGHTVSSCDPCGSNGNSTFGLTPSGLGNNGPYAVTATATANETLLGLNPQSRTSSASTGFSVAVRPATPHVSTVVNGDGSVTVTWSRNTEADLLGYEVKRGGANVLPFLAQPHSGATVSWTDTTTSQGGDFGYVVYAFRPGSDGTANTALFSSAAATASVPVPPPPSTTTVAPGGFVVPASTTTTVASSGSASGAPDLSAFLAQAGKAGVVSHAPASAGPSRSAPPRLVAPGGAGVAAPPDTYQPTLPFGRAGPRTAESPGAPRIALPSKSASSTQSTLLYSVAGGLLLCVLGLALRKYNQGSEARALDPVPSRPGRAGGAATAGEDEAGAAAAVGGAGGVTAVARRPASARAKANARAAAAARGAHGAPDETAAGANGTTGAAAVAAVAEASVRPQVDGLSHLPPLAGPAGRRSAAADVDTDYFGLIRARREASDAPGHVEVPTPAG